MRQRHHNVRHDAALIAPQLKGCDDLFPVDEEYAAKLHDLIDRMTWAIDAAASVNAGYGFGKEEVV